ncbi:MAG: hypothetical protein M0P64_01865 [Candidatus Pacebacteria bacterium]|jgi:hypothetical protein|nr:hypothetical protein [Candidatus Paceibacterota bacterium]
MPLSFLTKSKSNKPLTLLVDIGSASVGAALIRIEKGTAPVVLASVREDISFQDALSAQRFLFAMGRTLENVLKKLQVSSVGAPGAVFCTMSSPWFILKTRNLHIERDVEFEVTPETLEGFINEDVELLKVELKETLPPQDVHVIEKKIIQMKLNGYEIKNPYKQRTDRMELAATVGVSSEKVIKSIEHKIHKFFHVKEIHFGAFPVAAFNTIRDMYPTEKNFLFLDITGEATDVSRVSDDLLVGTISFPYGKNFFIREISARLRTVHAEAASLFAMYLRGELDEARRAQIAEVVAFVEGKWLARFEKVISTLANKQALPGKIFFTTDADIEPIFSKLILSAKSELLIGAAFEVQYLDQLIVSKFVAFEAGVVRDPFIVVEALLAEKLTEQLSK